MNKKNIFIVFLGVMILAYIFQLDLIVSNKISNINTNLKEAYLSKYTSLKDNITKYFFQTQQIENLKKQLKKTEKIQLLQQVNSNQYKPNINKQITKINVISYKKFNDFSNVILENTDKLDQDNIGALITNDGFSAGIAIKQDNQIVGLLNHNEKSNYAVFIGKDKIPGITKGDHSKENITIEFVPIWKKVSIGDKVITSGMDDIFTQGIPVGEVVKIKKLLTSQDVLVKPYASVYDKKYFYLYTKTKESNTSK